MDITTRPCSVRLLAGLVLMATTLAACDIKRQKAPAVIGPSEFGLSISAIASPDQLPRDGSSQSIVSLTVRDEQSRPVEGQHLTVALAVGTVPGVLLSESEVVTGSDGRASFAVTAPPQTAIGGTEIRVIVRPVGTNFANAAVRSVTIGLTGVRNASAPVPVFTVSPTAPETLQTVTFDASGTTDEGAPCDDRCTYAWDFGDGASATGRIATHAYTVGSTYTVALTVTDAAGTVASTRTVVTITAPAAPTVSLVVAPAAPVVDQQATFTATATAATGHSIVGYAWDFGDGTTQTTTTPTVTKTFLSSQTVVVTVTVTDDRGQTGNASLSVSPTFPATASFTVSPSSASVAGTTLSFNASASTVGIGTTIASYAWNFGDGTVAITLATPTTTHVFAVAGTYVVQLTIADNLGRTATTTVAVVVQ
jgi:PKD repeat protein